MTRRIGTGVSGGECRRIAMGCDGEGAEIRAEGYQEQLGGRGCFSRCPHSSHRCYCYCYCERPPLTGQASIHGQAQSLVESMRRRTSRCTACMANGTHELQSSSWCCALKVAGHVACRQVMKQATRHHGKRPWLHM